MRFLLLYIRRNLRHRRGSYLLSFFACLLSGLLICTSVFYLTLERKPMEETAASPFDVMIYSVSSEKGEAIRLGLEEQTDLRLREELPYADLMPIYADEIDAFDENPPQSSLNFALTEPDSGIAAFFAANGCDPAALGEGEVYVSRHVYYYFDAHISGDTLTLDRLRDAEGAPLKLRIRGVYGDLLRDAVSILSTDSRLMEALGEQLYGECSLIFCDYSEGVLPDLYRSVFAGTPLEELRLSTHHFMHRFPDSLYREEGFSIYTGDIAIAAFNLFFALLCTVSSLKLKLDREAEDYRRMKNLGLSPLLRGLMPTMDVMPLGIPAFAFAFCISALLFTKLAPRGALGLESTTFTYEFICTPTIAAVCAALFFGMLLVMLLILTAILILRSPRDDSTYVKISADFYNGASRFIPTYPLLRLLRNKGYSLFFALIVALPLIVAGMYATSSGGRLMAEHTPFADADYIITGAGGQGGVNERIAADIAAISGVESLHRVRGSGEVYAFSAEELSVEASLTALDAYTAPRLEGWLSEGSLEAVMQTPYTVAAVDNGGMLSVGDLLHCDAIGADLTVGALLTEFPQEGSELCFFVGSETLDEIAKGRALPEDMHVYLRADITDGAYAALKKELPVRLYDPRMKAVNQRDESALSQYNGEMLSRIAAVMNLLICGSAILSVFLLHTQRQLARRREFSILMKLGFSRGELRRSVHVESILPALLGFVLFGILFWLYIAGINNAIRMEGAYQYSGFAVAWGELVIIAALILTALTAADLIATAEEKPKRGKRHEN